MTDDLVCPICKTKAKPLDNMVYTTGFDCPTHRRFRVAITVKATPALWNASEEKWEKALQRARDRQPNEWAPKIETSDFDYG
jgi:Xaa-Pro aminopeptidase